MRTAIVTDSNSGITQTQARELGVFVLPMPFTINGQDYYEDINLTQREFYEKLKEGREGCDSRAGACRNPVECEFKLSGGGRSIR